MHCGMGDGLRGNGSIWKGIAAYAEPRHCPTASPQFELNQCEQGRGQGGKELTSVTVLVFMP